MAHLLSMEYISSLNKPSFTSLCLALEFFPVWIQEPILGGCPRGLDTIWVVAILSCPPLFPTALDKSHCSSETVRMPHFSLQVTAKQPSNPFLKPHQSLAFNVHFSSSEGFCLCFSSRPHGSLLALFSLYASFYLSYFPPNSATIQITQIFSDASKLISSLMSWCYPSLMSSLFFEISWRFFYTVLPLLLPLG